MKVIICVNAFATGRVCPNQPHQSGQPEQVEIRVRLRRKNADYGNPSQIATVTVNP